MPIHAPFGWFFRDLTPRWDIISKKFPIVKSTGHNGSNGLLTMPASVVVPENLPGQKGATKK